MIEPIKVYNNPTTNNANPGFKGKKADEDKTMTVICVKVGCQPIKPVVEEGEGKKLNIFA